MSNHAHDELDKEAKDEQVNPALAEAARPLIENIATMIDWKVEAALKPLQERLESLERRLNELTGEADTAPSEDYDSGEA